MNNTPKHQVKVYGKMNEADAGVVGRRLANAAQIVAVGVVLVALVAVIRWW